MTSLPEVYLNSLCEKMRRQAHTGIWDGRSISAYFLTCRHLIVSVGLTLIYTRDEGMHSGGWWKNPDYERCYHLSVSFQDGYKASLVQQIADKLFGSHVGKVWIEPPYSPEGKRLDIHHYRLFCDPMWRPIQPRGEVYSTQHTPVRWRSFSEIHGTKPVIRPTL